MIRIHRALALVAVLWFLGSMAGCATGGAGPSKGSGLSRLTKTPEMEAAFQKADKLYFARKTAEAQAAFETYIAQFPYNALTPKAYFRLGEIAFGAKDFVKAIGLYKRARERGVSPDWGAYAIYKQAVAHSNLEEYPKVISTLDAIPRDSTDKKVAVRAASLRIATARKLEDPFQEKIGYLEAVDAFEGLAPGDTQVGDLNWVVSAQAARGALRAWIAEEPGVDTGKDLGNNPDKVKGLWKRFEGKTSGGYVAWKLARLYDQAGDYKKSADWAQRYAQGYPKGEYMSKARALLAELEKRGASPGPIPEEKRGYIGVLLPLSGKYAVYGESVLHGLECAAGVFGPCRGDLGLNLLVRDTQGDPSRASKIVAEFAANPEVRTVIGPLPQVEVDQAASAAETSQIPMVTLSQKADVAKQGQYIFRNFLTVADQVASLVDYTCGEKKWKKYAILYPEGPTGQEYKKAFEDEVSRCGGKVLAQAGYAPDTRSFGDAVRLLMTSTNSEQAPEEKAPFEALFIPDVYRKIPDVVSAMKSAGLTGIRLMGGAGWDHPGLLNAGAEALEGAVYVNGFYAKGSSFPVRDFVAMFQAAYGFEPTILEAYAFDTMRLVGEVLRDNPTSSRADLMTTMAKKRNFQGVTGTISFDDDGDARRRLSVLSISNGEVREVQ